MYFCLPLTCLCMDLGEDRAKGSFGRLYVKIICKTHTPTAISVSLWLFYKGQVPLQRILHFTTLLVQPNVSHCKRQSPCLSPGQSPVLSGAAVEMAEASVILNTFGELSWIFKQTNFKLDYYLSCWTAVIRSTTTELTF